MYHAYPYQEEGLDALQAVRDQGIRKALVVMATGLGKTVTVAIDVKRFLSCNSGRVLFLCHVNDILYQAKTTFQAVNGMDHTYGYFHGEEKNFHQVDFLFASLQTMERYRELFSPDEFVYVVVDESHHAHADTFRSVIEYFHPQFLLGVTATPDRLDELDIREIFGREIFSLPLEDAMARGLVTPVDYRLLTDEIQLSEVLETDEGKRVSISYLNRKIFIPRRDEEIASIITRYAAEVSNPRIIIFCASIAHCDHLAQFVPDSFVIHSKVPERERAVKLEMFRQGIVSTVLTVDAFNEGIDIPQANIIVFLRSTTSSTIFLQQLGRGLRKSDGKDKVLVLDFVANCERIKMVHTLWRKVRDETLAYNTNQEGGASGIEDPMSLNVNSVEFIEKVVPLFNLMERLKPNFYATWQEASQAALCLNIRSASHYRRTRKSDPRLPGDPWHTYSDFPGWNTFLSKVEKSTYATWEEASRAARNLGIVSSREYAKGKYKEDPRLPFDPTVAYSNFPGWVVFLGRAEKDFYETWQEASAAARTLGLLSRSEYSEGYGRDSRLPSAPQDFYEDFPGWGEFTGTWRTRVRSSDTYPTWRDAGRAAQILGIKGKNDYRTRYKDDSRLPSSPKARYADFPGWKEFLDVK